MNVANYIESQYRSFNKEINYEFLELYQTFQHEKLKEIFSTLHAKLVSNFKMMNERLPTTEYENHFWAEPSRELIAAIDMIEGLKRSLKSTNYSFVVEPYYQSIIDKCNTFLNKSGGSTIPLNMDKIELYYIIPVFIPQSTIIVSNPDVHKAFELKLIGEGSYAQVFKYKDKYYKKEFVLKRAKKDLNEKEIIRFKREYEQMKNLHSPYIVEVYKYNDLDNEYLMEYMDFSLHDYIGKNNSKITISQRRSLANQVLKAFLYIHSKRLLHRDISPKNILIKQYDDVAVVKIADFGLVRIPDSSLTSVGTEFKGYFNDPNLMLIGFDKYNIIHETYALTRLLFFIMEGKTNTDKVDNPQMKAFLSQGLCTDESKRFKSIEAMIREFQVK
jgi:serine/threonine-protein kinase